MNEKVTRITVIGNIVLLIILSIFSFQLLSSPRPFILLDYANLVIHETGGVLFIFFGQFFLMLGQNIYQNLMPFLFFLYFFRRKSFASAAFCFFWLGDNLIQTGVYMKDAKTMTLPLVSIWGSTENGQGHDFHYIFSQLGILPYDQIIGGLFWWIGAICVILSILSLLYILKIQIKEIIHY